ncbi:hypothetical protein QP185_01190 [Sphingomonas aerolata]
MRQVEFRRPQQIAKKQRDRRRHQCQNPIEWRDPDQALDQEVTNADLTIFGRPPHDETAQDEEYINAERSGHGKRVNIRHLSDLHHRVKIDYRQCSDTAQILQGRQVHPGFWYGGH